ncbi:uroporphyrinogen-III synthase [Rhizobium cremeum]|nr:uroporphyrinogen-III synthase [Rhizobium cremeum]MCJ7999876.1 uroporphyrinogen-III synthase [Rhizobium cremeum]
MRVLVTRPEPSATRTAERLRRLGHVPVVLPLARAVHDVQAVGAALASPHVAIAVTSAEAVRALEEMGSDAISPYREDLFFAVGNASAEAARQLGFRRILAGDGDGAALAAIIAGNIGGGISTERPLLYLAGKPRASGLEDALQEWRIPASVCECYRMEDTLIAEQALRACLVEQPVDAILFYSPESVRRFFALPFINAHREALAPMKFLCLSEKIRSALPPELQRKACAAEAPAESSLLALL